MQFIAVFMIAHVEAQYRININDLVEMKNIVWNSLLLCEILLSFKFITKRKDEML